MPAKALVSASGLPNTLAASKPVAMCGIELPSEKALPAVGPCIEEVAYRKGFINKEQFQNCASVLGKSTYAEYLRKIAK